MNIAVCDNEENYRMHIISLLNQFNKNKLSLNIQQFNSGKLLLEAYKTIGIFDIIFLNIEVERVNGIDIAKMIRKMDKNVIIIFIANYDHYVYDAFEVDALHYLVKPITYDVFERTICRGLKRYFEKRIIYKLTWKDQITTVRLQDIIYVECYQRHIIVCTTKGMIEAKECFRDAESKLTVHGFIKPHQSYLVNNDHIIRVDKKEIVCINNNIIPISVRKCKIIHEQYNSYLKAKCL